MSVVRWIFAALLVCGCEATEELPTVPAPEVIYGGCVEFGPETCILERPTKLSIWLDVSPATPLLVRIDGAPVPSTGRIVHGGGLRLAVKVPEGADTVQVETPEQSWSPELTLGFEWRERPPIDGLSAKELRAFVKESSGWAKLRALERLRRMSRGRPAGLPVGEAELSLARELGATHHEAIVLAQRAHTFTEIARDLRKAREALDALEPLTETSPFAAARWQYHNALLSRRAGNLGIAIAGFEDAQVLSERVDFGVTDVTEMLANTLAELGRADEARPLFRQVESDLWEKDLLCSEWVRIANNFAWGQLVLGAAGYEHNDPRPSLLTALERIDSCPDPWHEAALLLDLAFAELEYGRPLEAQGWLARTGALPSDLAGWVEMASATAALDRGDLRNQPTLLVRPAETRAIELAWNQSVLYGDQLVAWGFHTVAAEAYRAAEDQLTATFEQVGTDKGGELYLAGRSASLEGLVRALLTTGRHAEASCAIRIARTREFARLDRTALLSAATEDERAGWEREIAEIARQQRAVDVGRAKLWEVPAPDQVQVATRLSAQTRVNRERLDVAVQGLGLEPTPDSCVELRAPSEGEVILVAFNSFVFAESESGTQVSTRSDLSPLNALEDASLITLLDTGSEGAPLHLAPWRHAKSLIDLAPIGYSLDLPPRSASRRATRTALVLADPRNDLPEARAEADAVRRSLEANDWQVIELRGSNATASSLVEHAARIDLLHYAGHGVRSGLSGWDSALLLADSGRFGIHDVFTLPEVPRGVVLTGCDTAAFSPDTVSGGMNIGRAFVLAGSEWVIAADAEVADQFAADVGAAVHRGQAQDGPTRLREALLSLRAENPEFPWQHFRVITP